jgi:type I restriction-modification system DNA methylase subunit
MISSQNDIIVANLRPYLRDCGYSASQMVTNVEVAQGRRIPLAAFAQSPHDSRSACIAVIDGLSDPEAAVVGCRGLGAPIVFTYLPDQWQFWKQSAPRPQFLRRILEGELPNFFHQQKKELAPESIYRAKTWARFDRSYQLEFVDLGLMPLVEEEAGRKLAELVERTVSDTKSNLGWKDISQEQGHWLLKSNFWLLAAKILKDKNVSAFAKISLENLQEVFACVAEHYGATAPVKVGPKQQAEALRESAQNISRFSHLGLVSTDALAYLYENALISKDIRAVLGTHSTPTYLVDYIVGKLRPWIEEIPINERQVFEPACGHAAFLLAAMQLLGDLLAESTFSPTKRHQYLRTRLHGCDVDSFALEIARLRLTLADVPNPNGWDLQAADIFQNDILARRSRTTNIILANPPFANFSAAERRRIDLRSTETPHLNKAAEMLRRVVANMRPGAVFGVVLPQGLLSSQNVGSLRRLLATEFEIREICLLPGNVFVFSGAESVVILGRRLQARQQNVSTLYRHVRQFDVQNFKDSYEATYDFKVESARFSATDEWNFFVPDLEEVWKFCREFPRFDDVAEIGKGFEFRSHADPLFPGQSVTISARQRDGLVKGFVRLGETLQTHQQPDVFWINLHPSVIRRSGLGTTTGIPQLLLNYARVSYDPWRLKAFLDKEGHPVTSRFLVIRPRDTRWPLEALWGICNSPFANAYSYAFSAKRDVLAGLMRQMPLPDTADVNPLIEAVRTYLDSTRSLGDVLVTPTNSESLKALHWRIDAEVLRLYKLPPHLERQVLNLFSGVERRGVPFEQKEYFPKSLTELSTLRELMAITVDWEKTNERRAQLIARKVKKNILINEKNELEYLQQLTDARIRLLAPLPIKQLEAVREDLMRRGMWEED